VRPQKLGNWDGLRLLGVWGSRGRELWLLVLGVRFGPGIWDLAMGKGWSMGFG